jgi:hypothetical protein
MFNLHVSWLNNNMLIWFNRRKPCFLILNSSSNLVPCIFFQISKERNLVFFIKRDLNWEPKSLPPYLKSSISVDTDFLCSENQKEVCRYRLIKNECDGKGTFFCYNTYGNRYYRERNLNLVKRRRCDNIRKRK